MANTTTKPTLAILALTLLAAALLGACFLWVGEGGRRWRGSEYDPNPVVENRSPGSSSNSYPHRDNGARGDSIKFNQSNEGSESGGTKGDENVSDTKPGANPVEESGPKVLPIRWSPPALSWSSDAKLDVIADESIADRGRTPIVDEVPENSLVLYISAYDELTREQIKVVWVDVVDQHKHLRASGWIGKPTLGYRGFYIPYADRACLLIRVKADGKVGFAVFGTGSGAPPLRNSTGSLLRPSPGNRFSADLSISLSSEAQRIAQGASIRVVDGHGRPLALATCYSGCQVLGQTNSAGVATFAMTRLEDANATTRGPWRAMVAVHYPGKVPVFIKPEELAPNTTVYVSLYADEIVVQFWLKLPPDTPVDNIEPGSADDYLLDRGVFAPDDDPKALVKEARWNVIRGHLLYGSQAKNHLALEAVVKRDLRDWEAQHEYNYWYTRQWKCDDETGNWQVVIPHKGRFIISIGEKVGDVMFAGSMHKAPMMYPGLYLDATDPANPKVNFIYPP